MIKAKKSLGQNFLIDKNVLTKIIKLVPIEDRTILEVGPGTGNLTSYILKQKPKKMIVVEKDDTLIDHLLSEFENKLTIINNDILKINENNLSNEILTVFGNLPYNISTEILVKWILNLNGFVITAVNSIVPSIPASLSGEAPVLVLILKRLASILSIYHVEPLL